MFIIYVGIGILIFAFICFSLGVFYIREAKKQQQKFLKTQADFKEYQNYKKEIGI